MNILSTKILKILENSPCELMGSHILNKQAQELDLDLDELTVDDIPSLLQKLEAVLPYYAGDATPGIIEAVAKLVKEEAEKDKGEPLLNDDAEIRGLEKTQENKVVDEQSLRSLWRSLHSLKEDKIQLETCTTYLILEDKPNRSYEMLEEMVKRGKPGLCITRIHPEKLRKRYTLGATEIHWLSDIDTEISIVPTNLQGMFNKMRNFIQKNEGCIVLLEGIEFLSTYNNFTSIVKFTQTLYDTVVLNNAILIITINPVAFSPEKFALLKRNTVTVDCMRIEDSD